MEFTMALKGQISLTFFSVSVLALELSLVIFPATPGLTGQVGARSASFRGAYHPVSVSPIPTEAKLSGVLIPDAGEFPVVQQPMGDSNYVSKNDGELTQFTSAAQYGNIGLLAHNYLSGRSFSQMHLGQEVELEYSDGSVENFVVSQILRYKALDPKSPYSSFQNVDNQNEILTVDQMFDRAYQGNRHITFQTCIAAEGNSSWGRLFIIASPEPNKLGVDPNSLVTIP